MNCNTFDNNENIKDIEFCVFDQNYLQLLNTTTWIDIFTIL